MTEPTKPGTLRQSIICPNCLSTAVLEGNEIICEACDATYTIAKSGTARVKTLGRLADHEERLKKLEAALPGEKPPDRKGAGNGSHVSEGEENEEEEEQDLIPE